MLKNRAGQYFSGYMLSIAITLTVLWKIGVADTGIEWLFSAGLVGGEIVKNFLVLTAISCVYKYRPQSAFHPGEVFFVGVMFGATLLVFFVVASGFNALSQNSSFFREFGAWSSLIAFVLKEVIFGVGQAIVIFSGVFILRAVRSRT
jgi:hypothetical protein